MGGTAIATTTPRQGLTLPAITDPALISDINNNMTVLDTDTVFLNKANTANAAMTLDMTLASVTGGLIVPNAAGAAPVADGAIAFDATAETLVFGTDGATKQVVTTTGTASLTLTGPAGVASSRMVGIVATSGAPTTGTWQQWDMGFDEGGGMYMCTVAGTPGTWIQVGGAMTGDLKATFRNTSDPGWALCYGQTVNATAAPYLNIWTYASANGLVGSNLPFAGSQSALIFPDLRGMALAGLDNMGGSARGLIAGLSGLGKTVGEAAHTLTVGEMPSHNHTATSTDSGHSHTIPLQNTSGPGSGSGTDVGTGSTTPTGTGFANITTTINNTGGGAAHNVVQPTCGANIEVKL